MSLHAFLYAGGNPVGNIDPQGTDWFSDMLKAFQPQPGLPPAYANAQRAPAVAAAPVIEATAKAMETGGKVVAGATLLAATGGTAGIGTAVGLGLLGATGEVAFKTYEDPAHPKTLDQFTMSDVGDVALASGTTAATGAALGALGQAGKAGKAIVKGVQVGVGLLAVGEGGRQVAAGVESGDMCRVGYGLSVGLLGVAAVSDALPGRFNAGNYDVLFDAEALYSNPLPKVKYRGQAVAEAQQERLPRHLRNKLKHIENATAAGGLRGVTGAVAEEEALALGERFVGSGYRVTNEGRLLISADGLRQFRMPSVKRGINPLTGESFSRTGVQVNFESRPVPDGRWPNNVHLDVLEP
jgi:hypothetical protein